MCVHLRLRVCEGEVGFYVNERKKERVREREYMCVRERGSLLRSVCGDVASMFSLFPRLKGKKFDRQTKLFQVGYNIKRWPTAKSVANVRFEIETQWQDFKSFSSFL